MSISHLLSLSLVLLMVGCGQADFTGEADSQTGEKQPLNSNRDAFPNAEATGALTSEQEVTEYFDDSTEGKALKSCLRSWGISKMKKETLDGVKILEGSNGGLLSNSEVADLDFTEERALILVKVSTAGILARTTLKLMNPMGMYCLYSETSGPLADFIVQKHCKAKLASDTSSTNGLLANKTMSNTECS